MKNVEELKIVVRTAIFSELIEKTKNCAIIWNSIAVGQYFSESDNYKFYISKTSLETYNLDILKYNKLYISYNSNFDPILFNLYKEIDYFIINEKLKKHRIISNVVGAAEPVDTVEVKLFDESSWENIVPEPYLSYLNFGKTRWENFLNYNPDAISGIQLLDPSWVGLRLNNYTEFDSSVSPIIASCNIHEYIDLQAVGVQFNSISFNLNVNAYFKSSFDEHDWINIITHEMGHALGIGIFWNSFFNTQGSIPPSNNFLSSNYSKTQQAYNNVTGLVRSKIPLESIGGSGTASAHWENNYRSSTAVGGNNVDYYGIENEIMIGYYEAGSNLIISDISIKHLVDLGYNEKNKGANEGYVIISNEISLYAQNEKKIKFNRDFDFEKMIKIG